MNAPGREVGLVGVGLLGGAIAERLLEGGWGVVGYDCESARLTALADAGGVVMESAAAVLRRSPRVVLCLPDSVAVGAVVDEIMPSLGQDAVIVDTTTGEPNATTAIAERLTDFGATYLDATVAGSSQQARDGEAVLMVGGSAGAVEENSDLLSALGSRFFHVGPNGSGARMKLVVNLVLGLNRAVLAEGLALAERCGMDLRQTLEVLRSGAAYSAAMDTKGAKMVTGDFAPQARADQHLKDVRLIRELATGVDAHVPLLKVHEELLYEVRRLGLGAADNSAVFAAYSRRRGGNDTSDPVD